MFVGGSFRWDGGGDTRTRLMSILSVYTDIIKTIMCRVMTRLNKWAGSHSVVTCSFASGQFR